MRIINKLFSIFKKNETKNQTNNKTIQTEERIDWLYRRSTSEEFINRDGISLELVVIPDDISADSFSRVFRKELINLHMQCRLERRFYFKNSHLISKAIVEEINNGEMIKQNNEIYSLIKNIEMSENKQTIDYEKNKFFKILGCDYDSCKCIALNYNDDDIKNLSDNVYKMVVRNIRNIEQLKTDIKNIRSNSVSSNVLNFRNEFKIIDKERTFTQKELFDIDFLGEDAAKKFNNKKLKK